MLSPVLTNGQPGNNDDGISFEIYIDGIYGADQRLVSGDYYYEPSYNNDDIDGHPFLIDGEWKDGTVVIEGVEFDNLRLRYDLAIQKVILQYTDISLAKYQIILKNEHIDSFKIDKRRFCTMPNKNVRFCEIMSEGHIDYIIFRSKEKMVSSFSVTKQYEYSASNWQYLRIDGELIPFKRNTLYKLFPALKREIKQFTKKHKLFMNKNDFMDRKLIVDYCNTLPGFQKLSKQ